MPEIAYETVRFEIETSDVPFGGNDFPIIVADRAVMSPVLEF